MRMDIAKNFADLETVIFFVFMAVVAIGSMFIKREPDEK